MGELAKKVFQAFSVSPSGSTEGSTSEEVTPRVHKESMASSLVNPSPGDHSLPSSVNGEIHPGLRPVAVKVWSEILDEAIWVVADDLPQGEHPIDAPIYTHGEVKILAEVGPKVLAWVHTMKHDFGCQVVASRRRPERRFSDANAE
jgi:hypothetical protein